MKFTTIIQNKSIEIELSESMDSIKIVNDSDNISVDITALGKNSYSLILNGKCHYLTINPAMEGYEITVDHHTQIVQILDETDILLKKIGMARSNHDNTGIIKAPIPGLVSQIFVTEGEKVTINQKLLILEAMKMENEIDSPMEGTVQNIHIESGSKVEKGDIIMEINK